MDSHDSSADLLPERWVDSLFAKFAVRYGTAWVRMWEGIDMAAVKADWRSELARFSGDSIGYALRYLPAERPPTVAQFRDICRRAPSAPAPKQIEAPLADPARVQQALAGLNRRREKDPKAWAYALQDREMNRGGGKDMTQFQREAWREEIEPRTLVFVDGDTLTNP